MGFIEGDEMRAFDATSMDDAVRSGERVAKEVLAAL